MDLESFLYNLHFDIDKARPLDLEVDWDDGPLAYKLYRGLPVIPLSPEVPLTLEGREVTATPDLREIGHFLWYVYGLTQISQSVNISYSTVDALGPMQSIRRFVPSGGALYPNELYVYLKLSDLPVGIYHYDVAHHRLVLLREGNFDSYLARALGNRCDVADCFGTVFVSTMFWKNFFKYHNFAYRLQGLDAGVMIGQLLETAKRFGYATGVYFQFLDRAINHLLGLTEQEESVYAVIPLSVEPALTWFADTSYENGSVSASDLSRELAPIQPAHYVRSRRIMEYPMLINMNEASMLDSTRLFRQIRRENNDIIEGQAVALPYVKRESYDLAAVCRKRYSPESGFVLRKVNRVQLASLLQDATASFPYRNDLDGAGQKSASRVSLYGCLYHVEDIPDGAYYYDSAAHTLQLVRPGDHRMLLQQGLSLDNVNLFQVPLCLHVAGGKDHLIKELRYRGYRIQQMEAGMLVHRLLLAAIANGMGGHPLLGFDVNACDEIYKMAPRGKTSLIQIPIGPYRHRPRLQGGLHS